MKLKPQQRQAIAKAMRYDGFALYMDQGTGKTLTALTLVLLRGVKRILVAGPITALDVWSTQIAEAGFDINVVRLDKGFSSVPVDTSTHRKPTILVCNYELLWRRLKLVQRWAPEFVIADECQALRKRTSRQSKALHALGDQAKYRLLLSGTPLDRSEVEIWSQYRFACPEVFGDWGDFTDEYCRDIGWGYTKWVVRKQAEKRLIKKIRSRMFRVTRQKTLNLLPIKRRIVWIKMNHTAARLYRLLELEDVVWVNDAPVFSSLPITRVNKLAQITGGFVKDVEKQTHHLGNFKVQALIRQLRRIDGKVVIFARHIAEVNAAFEACQLLGLRPVKFVGGLTPEERRIARSSFANDPVVRAFVAQVRAGGVGINELIVASEVIFYSMDHSWISYDQAVARLHRSGQKKPVTVTHLVIRGTVDEDILRSVWAKERITGLVLRINKRRGMETKPLVGTELDARISQLFEAVRKQGAEKKSMTKDQNKPHKVKKPISSTTQEDTGPVVTLKDIAFEFGLTTKTLRRALRKEKVKRTGGRWEWNPETMPNRVKKIKKIAKQLKG